MVSGYSADVIYVNNLNGETVPAADLAIGTTATRRDLIFR